MLTQGTFSLAIEALENHKECLPVVKNALHFLTVIAKEGEIGSQAMLHSLI